MKKIKLCQKLTNMQNCKLIWLKNILLLIFYIKNSHTHIILKTILVVNNQLYIILEIKVNILTKLILLVKNYYIKNSILVIP